jgi:hypothetical protein
MPYDIKAALDSGYSMKEVIAHLSNTVDTLKQQLVAPQQPAPADTANIFNVQNNSPSLPTLGQLQPVTHVMRTPPPPQSEINPAPAPSGAAMGPAAPLDDTEQKKAIVGAISESGGTGRLVFRNGSMEPSSKTVAVQQDTGKKVYEPATQTPQALIDAKKSDAASKSVVVETKVNKPPAPEQPAPKPPVSEAQAAVSNKTAQQTTLAQVTTANPSKVFKAQPIVDTLTNYSKAPDTPPKAAALVQALIPTVQQWNTMPFPAVQQRLEALAVPAKSLNSNNMDQALQAQAQASVAQLVRTQIDAAVSSSANPEIRDQWKTLRDFNRVLASSVPINSQNIITKQPLDIPAHQLELSNKPNDVLATMYAQAYQAQQQKLPENPRMVMGAMSPQQPPTPYPTSGQQTLAGPGGTSQASQAPVGSNERAIADAKQTYDDWMANNQLINELKQRGQALTLGNINLPIRRRKLK